MTAFSPDGVWRQVGIDQQTDLRMWGSVLCFEGLAAEFGRRFNLRASALGERACN
jgi:hypothetical protein